jgi:hypothetical protein
MHTFAEVIDILADPRMARWSRGENKSRTSLMLISHLCALLTPILLYGLPSTSLALLKEYHLLTAVSKAIVNFLKTEGTDEANINMCVRFYTHFVQSKCKLEKLDDDTEEKEDAKLSDAKTIEHSISSSAPLNLSQDLISSYFNLHRQIQRISLLDEKSVQQEQIQALLKEEWKKLDILQLQHDYEQLKHENMSLQEELSQLKDKLQRTQLENDQFRKENIRMAQEIDNLKLMPTTSITIESQQLSNSASAVNNNKDNTIDELTNLSPHEISKEQAEQCIREIYHRRTTFNDHDMRKSICGSLKHLGSDLYSSPVHFLHELIQVHFFSFYFNYYNYISSAIECRRQFL